MVWLLDCGGWRRGWTLRRRVFLSLLLALDVTGLAASASCGLHVPPTLIVTWDCKVKINPLSPALPLVSIFFTAEGTNLGQSPGFPLGLSPGSCVACILHSGLQYANYLLWEIWSHLYVPGSSCWFAFALWYINLPASFIEKIIFPPLNCFQAIHRRPIDYMRLGPVLDLLSQARDLRIVPSPIACCHGDCRFIVNPEVTQWPRLLQCIFILALLGLLHFYRNFRRNSLIPSWWPWDFHWQRVEFLELLGKNWGLQNLSPTICLSYLSSEKFYSFLT